MNEAKTVEAKHIFIDIVNYTHNRSVEAQTDLIGFLNQFVKDSLTKEKVSFEKCICIPTGDGMCISLLEISNPFDIHIRIALEILKRIYSHNKKQENGMRKFNIRIGINENIDNLIIDINGNNNISGSGINFASRIEGLADENQILVGNSVYEKLVQREKYMNSFISYSAKVKHGLLINAHHYTNDKYPFLNNQIPSLFRPTQQKTFKLTATQAYYIANCLKYEDFISHNFEIGKGEHALHILFKQLADDELAKTEVTKSLPNPRVKIQRKLQDQYKYIQSLDFYITYDLFNYIVEKHLYSIYELFSDRYLFVNEEGIQQLKNDYPNIFKEFGFK